MMQTLLTDNDKKLTGLSETEVKNLFAKFGPNTLVPERSSSSLWLWAVRLIADPMAVLLSVAGGTYIVLGDRFDATIAFGALVPIVLVDVVLEKRADNALERLRALAAPTAYALRDGILRQIPVREIVPGDIVMLHEGDVIPADGVAVDGTELSVDESVLTGESLPVTRMFGGTAALLAGATLVSGHGAMHVTATGSRSEYGRIGALLGSVEQHASPIEVAIRRIVVQLSLLVAIASLVVAFIDRMHGASWPVAIIAAVSLAMAAVPEELPMVYTLYLALGAWQRKKRSCADCRAWRHLARLM